MNRPIRVAIEPSLTSEPSVTGIHRFTRLLLEPWDPEDGIETIEVRYPAWMRGIRPGLLRKFIYHLWLNLVFPFWVRRNGVDVVHHTNFMAPFLWKGAPTVISVHDLRYRHLPEYGWFYRWYQHTLLSAGFRKAASILAGSESVCREIRETFPTSESRVHCVPYGVDPRFRERTARREEWWLLVGPYYREKDHRTFLQAYLRRYRQGERRRVILVGRPGESTGDLKRFVREMDLKETVEFPGHVPEEQLVDLYQGAFALAYPTRWEGFGYPVLEAMACGTPVLASDLPVLREVAGDAAAFARGGDVEDWVRQMERLQDPAWRDSLARAGRERVRRFGMPRHRDQLRTIYESAAGRTGN